MLCLCALLLSCEAYLENSGVTHHGLTYFEAKHFTPRYNFFEQRPCHSPDFKYFDVLNCE